MALGKQQYNLAKKYFIYLKLDTYINADNLIG